MQEHFDISAEFVLQVVGESEEFPFSLGLRGQALLGLRLFAHLAPGQHVLLVVPRGKPLDQLRREAEFCRVQEKYPDTPGEPILQHGLVGLLSVEPNCRGRTDVALRAGDGPQPLPGTSARHALTLAGRRPWGGPLAGSSNWHQASKEGRRCCSTWHPSEKVQSAYDGSIGCVSGQYAVGPNRIPPVQPSTCEHNRIDRSIGQP